MTENNEKEIMRMLTKAVSTLQTVDTRLAKLESGQDELRVGQNELRVGQNEIKEDMSEIKKDIKVINKKLSIITNRNIDLEARVEILEDKALPAN